MGNRSLFDIVGPIMVGPSSSHTAGAVRLGLLARAIYGAQPAVAKIKLHGSFAATGDGHGTKLALVAGLLGMTPDDLRIPTALDVAREAGLQVEFSEVSLDDAHPNTAIFELSGGVASPESGAAPTAMTIAGSSVGGGAVEVTQIDDFPVSATGELPLIVVEHTDQPGVIHFVSGVLSENRINIASMRVSRENRGARALMLIETDGAPDRVTLARMLKQPQVHSVRFVPAI